jgi:tRNA G46 methylase TrmB
VLDGVDARLKAGARIADVWCGHGASAVTMAAPYPNSIFSGFDFHAPSIATCIERARERARRLPGRHLARIC